LFINVPIGVVLIVVTAITVQESRSATATRSLDLPGAITVTAGLATLVYGIVGTDSHSWGSPATMVPLALGVALLALFLLIEARFARNPLVPLGVFRIRSLSVSNGIAMALGSALFGFFFFLTLYMQQINGYSALKGGVAFLPAGLATLTGALVGTRLVTRLGARRQLVLGPLLAAGGFVWLTVLTPGNGYFDHIFGPLVMTGFGFGLSFVPMTLTATGGLPPSQAGLAAGLVNTTRQVGGAIGLAIMGTVAANAASQNNGTVKSIAAALTTGYDRAFLIGACALLVGVGLATLLPSGNRAVATQAAPVTARPEPSIVNLSEGEAAWVSSEA